MNTLKLNKYNILLFAILILATFLRFYKLWDLPYMHDEISALRRLNFNSFSDLIKYGVKIGDSHPPGVHIFLYYFTHWFGDAAWIIKLPTIILGIWSVYLIFSIGKLWFGKSSGLYAALLMATLQFPIEQSQIARPYGYGVAFVLLFTLYWFKIIFKNETNFKNYLIFFLAASFSSYIHHFSLLMVFIIGLSGLFFLKKQSVLHYLSACTFIILAYLPNISITLAQLEKGGIEGWLGSFSPQLFLDYISYIFHHSWFVTVAVLITIIISYKRNSAKLNLQVLSLLWFVSPFIIGGIYSYFISNIVHFKVLYFGFPFILLFLSSFCNIFEKKQLVSYIISVGVIVFSLFSERLHYKLFPKHRYSFVLEEYFNSSFTSSKHLCLFDSNPSIDSLNISNSTYSKEFTPIYIHSFPTIKKFKSFLDTSEVDTIYFGTAQTYSPTFLSIVKEYFPTEIKYNNSISAECYWLSKEKSTIKWNNIKSEITISATSKESIKGIDSIYVDSNKVNWGYTKQPYFGNITLPLDKTINANIDFIELEMNLQLFEESGNAQLVASIEKDGKTYDWRSIKVNEFVQDSCEGKVLFSIKLPDIDYPKDAIFKTYLWNADQKAMGIERLNLIVRQGNPYIYAHRRKID